MVFNALGLTKKRKGKTNFWQERQHAQERQQDDDLV